VKRIALVDDDFAIRISTAILLKKRGFAVDNFESGEQFLLARVSDFDCILLDVQMPGMDGLEVLRALRKRENVPPVLVLSGNGHGPAVVSAIELGAREFLGKPYQPEALLAALERAFGTQPSRASG
jgi:FixJ family two-component response regulator